MGWDWAKAGEGLLGAVAEQAAIVGNRQAAIEQRRFELEQEDRKERAKAAKEAAFLKFQYDKMDQQEKIAYDRMDHQDKLAFARMDQQEKLAAAREERMAARAEAGANKPSAFAEKLAKIDEAEASKTLTPEEAKKARLKLYGAEDEGGKGGLSEYQQVEIKKDLAVLEPDGKPAIEDVAQANALREALGKPVWRKKVTKEASDGGSFGKATPEEVELELVAPKGDGILGGEKPVDLEKKDSLDMFRKELKGGGEKKAEKPTIAPEAKNTDLGTILGTITKGGVAGVKTLISGGKTILELDQELAAAAKAAHGESKSAIMEALQKVREVMASDAKLDPQQSANKYLGK